MWILNCHNNPGLIIQKSCSKWRGECSETALKGSEKALFTDDMRSLVISKFVREESLVISSCSPSAPYFVLLLVKVTSAFPHFVSIKRIHLVLQLEIRNCVQKHDAKPAVNVCFFHLNSRNVRYFQMCVHFTSILASWNLLRNSKSTSFRWLGTMRSSLGKPPFLRNPKFWKFRLWRSATNFRPLISLQSSARCEICIKFFPQ